MNDATNDLVQPLSIGAIAASALGTAQPCAVSHRFTSSAYLTPQSGTLICVGVDIPRGPLNLVFAPQDWRKITHQLDQPRSGNTRWAIEAPGIAVNSKLIISTVSCPTWRYPQDQPPTATISGPIAAMSDLLARLNASSVPSTLFALVADGPTSALSQPRAAPLWFPAARKAFRHFQRWLHADITAIPNQSKGLLGLGEGLTPAGDDFFVGALIALRAVGALNEFEHLASWLRTQLPPPGSAIQSAAMITNAISAAHLRAACCGQAIEPLHRVLDGLVRNHDDVSTWYARLLKHGASSGADALTGGLAVLTAAPTRRK